MDKPTFTSLTTDLEDLQSEFNRGKDWTYRAEILEQMAVLVRELDCLMETELHSFISPEAETSRPMIVVMK